MSWFKVDDSFYSHPKVLTIPRQQRAAVLGTWLLAGVWCASHETDGVIPAHMLDEIAASVEHAELLVKAKLWRKRGGTKAPEYVFHDWAEYQPLKADEAARRAAEAERKRIERAAKRAARQEEASARMSGKRPPGRPGVVRGESGSHADTRADASRPVPTPGLNQHSISSLSVPDRESEQGRDESSLGDTEKLLLLAAGSGIDLAKVRRQIRTSCQRIAPAGILAVLISELIGRTTVEVTDWTGWTITAIRNDPFVWQQRIDEAAA